MGEGNAIVRTLVYAELLSHNQRAFWMPSIYTKLGQPRCFIPPAYCRDYCGRSFAPSSFMNVKRVLRPQPTALIIRERSIS